MVNLESQSEKEAFVLGMSLNGLFYVNKGDIIIEHKSIIKVESYIEEIIAELVPRDIENKIINVNSFEIADMSAIVLN